MRRYSLSHLADHTLIRDTRALVGQDSTVTAELIAHLAEIDARKLYLPAACSSMFTYCVRELHLSEDAAAKRIQAARVARRFPVLFAALADGRLHLSAVVLLAPHLRHDNVEALLTAATHRSKAQIEQLLAERFPRPDLPARLTPIDPVIPGHAPGHVGGAILALTHGACPAAAVGSGPGEHAPGHVPALDSSHVPAPSAPACGPPLVAPPVPSTSRPRITPTSPGRYALQVTLSQELHDLLRYAEALLSHVLPAGDLEAVLERVLKTAIPELEQSRFAASECSRPGRRRPSANVRHIPAAVKRAVWQRDGGRCTFVSDGARRCEERRWIEFDHTKPVARGGDATVEGIRLRCRAHNQFEADRVFGVGFMREKREAAQQRAALSPK